MGHQACGIALAVAASGAGASHVAHIGATLHTALGEAGNTSHSAAAGLDIACIPAVDDVGRAAIASQATHIVAVAAQHVARVVAGAELNASAHIASQAAHTLAAAGDQARVVAALKASVAASRRPVVERTHQAAAIGARCGDGPRVVAVGHDKGILHVACKATHLGSAGHVALIVAASNSHARLAPVAVAYHAAHIAASASDGAVVDTVHNGVARIGRYNAAQRATSRDISLVGAIDDCASTVAGDTAHTAGTIEVGLVYTIGDTRVFACHRTHNAAYIAACGGHITLVDTIFRHAVAKQGIDDAAGIALLGSNELAAGQREVLEKAIGTTGKGTQVAIACDIDIGQGEVVQASLGAQGAKQALILILVVVDSDVAQRLAIAVEVGLKDGAAASHRHKVGLSREVDVVHHLEIVALKAVLLSSSEAAQGVHIGHSLDLIGAGSSAVAVPQLGHSAQRDGLGVALVGCHESVAQRGRVGLECDTQGAIVDLVVDALLERPRHAGKLVKRGRARHVVDRLGAVEGHHHLAMSIGSWLVAEGGEHRIHALLPVVLVGVEAVEGLAAGERGREQARAGAILAACSGLVLSNLAVVVVGPAGFLRQCGARNCTLLTIVAAGVDHAVVDVATHHGAARAARGNAACTAQGVHIACVDIVLHHSLGSRHLASDAAHVALGLGRVERIDGVGMHLAVVLAILHCAGMHSHDAAHHATARGDGAGIVATGDDRPRDRLCHDASTVGSNGSDIGIVAAILDAAQGDGSDTAGNLKGAHLAIVGQREVLDHAILVAIAKEARHAARLGPHGLATVVAMYRVDHKVVNSIAPAVVGAVEGVILVHVVAHTLEGWIALAVDVARLAEVVASELQRRRARGDGSIEGNEVLLRLDQVGVALGARAHKAGRIGRLHVYQLNILAIASRAHKQRGSTHTGEGDRAVVDDKARSIFGERIVFVHVPVDAVLCRDGESRLHLRGSLAIGKHDRRNAQVAHIGAGKRLELWIQSLLKGPYIGAVASEGDSAGELAGGGSHVAERVVECGIGDLLVVVATGEHRLLETDAIEAFVAGCSGHDHLSSV